MALLNTRNRFNDEPQKKILSFTQSLRRFVPSGGALYPNELYVYLKLEDIPMGIYHYDVAHHRLSCCEKEISIPTYQEVLEIAVIF